MDFILQLINLCLGDKILVCEKYMFNLYQKRKALILEFPLKKPNKFYKSSTKTIKISINSISHPFNKKYLCRLFMVS